MEIQIDKLGLEKLNVRLGKGDDQTTSVIGHQRETR